MTALCGVDRLAPRRLSCSRLSNSLTGAVSCTRVFFPKRPYSFFHISSCLSLTPQPGQPQAQSKRLDNQMRQGSLTEDGLSYKECFIIRSYEVGINKTATIEIVAKFLQEVGCNHPKSLGYSTDGLSTTPSMTNRHLIWVATRMHIEMYKYPTRGDVVEIETWCQSNGRIGMRREFILKDYATNDIIGRATSKWVMMNQATRKLEKVNREIYEEFLVYCPKTLRLAFPDENNKSEKKIPKLDGPVDYSRLGLKPKRGDFDMNQHVNNVTYIGWVLESIPQDTFQPHELRSITLDYRRECQLGDVVDSLTTTINAKGMKLNSRVNGINGTTSSFHEEREHYREFLHQLILSGDGHQINQGHTQWVRRKRIE